MSKEDNKYPHHVKKVIHKVWAENLKNYTVDKKSDTNGVYISLVQHQ